MKIRTAKIDDAEQISALIIAMSEKFICTDFSPEAKQVLLSSMAVNKIREYLAGDFIYFVAVTDNDEVQGVIGLKDNKHLYHLFIAENYHRQGLARKLWRRLLDELGDSALPEQITVKSSLYAQSAYERLGFERAGPDLNEQGIASVPMTYSRV